MQDEDFEPSEEEKVPENLRRKWDDEELEGDFSGKKMIPCRHCGKPVEKNSFSCLYCGQRIFSQSGILGKLGHSITQGTFFFVLLLLIVVLLILFLL